MSTFLSILAALLLLSLLVTIHELGHYTAGRLLGFTIVEFSVGMGPVVIKKEHKGIRYALRALPIGGMCMFYGEDQDAKDTRCFNAQPVWKRLITVFAGPLMNFVFAIVVSVIMLSAYGGYATSPVGDIVPQIQSIDTASSPAGIAGLQKGDVITVVNGKKIEYFDDVVNSIQASKDDQVYMTVLRNGEERTFLLKDTYNEAKQANYIGITIGALREHYTFFRCVGMSFETIGTVFTQTMEFFGRLFQGQAQSTDAAGPVGITVMISQAVRSGFETVLYLAILISISLGIMNLLPLPALDGGRMVFMVIEAVRGKPVPPEKEGMVHFIGMCLLLALVAFLTYNDIANLVRGVFS